MPFQINDPLSAEQWRAVEDAAFQILESTGMTVPYGPALDTLRSRPGFRVDGDRIRLDRSCVREASHAVRGSSAYDTPLISGAYSHHYLDPKTGKVRSPTLDDLVLSVRQADATGSGVCAPVVPLDVPGPVQEIVMERVTHENCRFSYGGGQATTLAAAEAGLEMSAVVNRPHELEIWVTSPLVLDPTGLEIAWKLRQRRPRVRISNMPVRGMSGPISLAGMLALTTAECLGAATVLRALSIAENLAFRIDAFWGYTMDPRTANVLLGGPDYLRLMILSIFLGRRYGIDRPMGKALLSSSKMPDEQAAAEKTAQALAAAMAGAGTFTAAGTLSLVEVFSPLQMIVDQEIVRWVNACQRDLDFSTADFPLDEIAAVGPGGTFMDRESTAARMRESFWMPQLFSVDSYPMWLTGGGRDLLDRARQTLGELKVADGPVVTRDQQRELAAIEKRFAAMVTTG